MEQSSIILGELRHKLYAEVFFVWVSDGIDMIWVWVAVGWLDII